MPITITCSQCSKDIKIPPSRLKTRNFCSLKCRYKWQSKHQKLPSGRRWTEDEDESLKQSYRKMTYQEIAKKLGRTTRAVGIRRITLGLDMKGRVNWRPTPSPDLAYILGVTLGDGWVGEKKVGLNVTDKEFAEAFKEALQSIGLSPTMKFYREQWLVRAYNTDFAKWFKSIKLKDIEQIVSPFKGAFIRGFYDSEGALITHTKKSGIYKYVELYNTDKNLLLLNQSLLDTLGLHSTLSMRQVIGEKGILDNGRAIVSQKDRYTLRVCRQTDVKKFLEETEPNIERKGETDWLNGV